MIMHRTHFSSKTGLGSSCVQAATWDLLVTYPVIDICGSPEFTQGGQL